MSIKEILLTFWQQPGEIKLLIVYVLIVWIIIHKDGEKRGRKRLKGCPVGQLQEDLRGAYRAQRQMEADHKRQMSDLDSDHKDRYKKLERDNSYLRSRLRNKR